MIELQYADASAVARELERRVLADPQRPPMEFREMPTYLANNRTRTLMILMLDTPYSERVRKWARAIDSRAGARRSRPIA